MGNLMALAAVNSRYATLWSCVVIVTLIAAVVYGVVAIIERIVLAGWPPSSCPGERDVRAASAPSGGARGSGKWRRGSCAGTSA